MKAVVSLSGGAQSFVAAQRAVAKFGASEVVCLFADTSAEDADLYRFVVQGAAALGTPLFVVRDGRTPQEVLRQRKFIGSGRGAPCSDLLKRKPVDAWLAANAGDAMLVVGLTWEEPHRLDAIQSRYTGDREVWAPLCEAPYFSRDAVFDAVKAAGVEPPRLYAKGYAHNNCGGACVRAGQAAWKHLHADNPELYASWEAWENSMRETVGDHSILRDRTDGKNKSLPLTQLRLAKDFDQYDIAGCGCFSDADAATRHTQEDA